jgi:hypothetical protein
MDYMSIVVFFIVMNAGLFLADLLGRKGEEEW